MGNTGACCLKHQCATLCWPIQPAWPLHLTRRLKQCDSASTFTTDRQEWWVTHPLWVLVCLKYKLIIQLSLRLLVSCTHEWINEWINALKKEKKMWHFAVYSLIFLRSVLSFSATGPSHSPNALLRSIQKCEKQLCLSFFSIMNPAPTFVVIAVIIMCYSYVMNVHWVLRHSRHKKNDVTDLVVNSYYEHTSKLQILTSARPQHLTSHIISRTLCNTPPMFLFYQSDALCSFYWMNIWLVRQRCFYYFQSFSPHFYYFKFVKWF